MADNRALFYAIAGIILMAMIVPLVLNPLPTVTNEPAKAAKESGLVGSATFNPNNPSATCIDHSKIDIYARSYITYNGVNYVDYCSGSNIVKMICSSNKLEKNSVSYPCTNACNSGACIR
jgi:hypothetical protein